jgi:hypothetical protein
MNARAFWLSTLIAGALMGLLANLPVLNLINCFLCIWIWLGGALAVYLYRRFHPVGVAPTVGQGALLGIVAGLIAAVVGAVVFTVTGAISMPIFSELARTLRVEGDFASRRWFENSWAVGWLLPAQHRALSLSRRSGRGHRGQPDAETGASRGSLGNAGSNRPDEPAGIGCSAT